jgi:protein-S-isoprenylcysteine O-methyltransferase Ste14
MFDLRGWLMLPPMVFIAFCTAGEVENEWLYFGLGGLVFALGLGLRVWAQMHLHYRLKVRKVLTLTGPYALVRNPIYIGNTLILAGACMLAELFWFVPIQVLYCALVYAFVVRSEEKHLADKYGSAYREYMSRVPRWLPRLGLARLSAGTGVFKAYFVSSLWSEAHTLLFLGPFVVKELLVS